MTIRTTVAGLATAFVLGAGALIGGSLATSSAAQAAPGWHGGWGHHGHFGHGYGRGRWGHYGAGNWEYSRFRRGGCYITTRTRFIPTVGYVERPVTICR